MATSTLIVVWGSATSSLNTYITDLWPIVIPAAIGLALLFAGLRWIHGASRRRF